MRIARFHVPSVALGATNLPPEEAHHARSVLRARVGGSVELFDGRGTIGRGSIRAVERRAVEVHVEQVEQVPDVLPFRLVIAVAMGKAHRQSYLVEKCTELGVSGIWMIRSQRSVAQPGDFAIDKASRRAIEACKQCGRAWTPIIEGPWSIEAALARRSEFARMALTDPDPRAAAFDAFLRALSPAASVLVWIGPEGGWTDAERSQLVAEGATPVQLARTILRTETAAIAACAAAAMLGLP